MGCDLRQVVAGVLTLTMFLMLGQMIKREHFDSASQDKLPGGVGDLENALIMEQTLVSLTKKTNGPWIEDSEPLKQCWDQSNMDEPEDTEGFVTFSLTNAPEYHVSQVSDAVVVARYLGATLVLPNIRGSKPGDEMNFEDIYDVDKFIKSLEGVVKTSKDMPSRISIRNLAVVKVPNRISEDRIAEHVEPVYRKKGNIKLATYFPSASVNMKKKEEKSNSDPAACLAMFGTLKLQQELVDVVDAMVDRLRALSRKSDGHFVAVDLRVDMLENKACNSDEKKSCYSPQEIAVFLRKIGFNKDTTIYLTQPRWDKSLNILKDIFPKTYTKENIMPADSRSKFLQSEDSELEKVIDFYLCAESDAFVPAISGLFYANVAGKRIASGKNQIIVPDDISGSAAHMTSYISPYVSKKEHLAYSCFC